MCILQHTPQPIPRHKLGDLFWLVCSILNSARRIMTTTCANRHWHFGHFLCQKVWHGLGSIVCLKPIKNLVANLFLYFRVENSGKSLATRGFGLTRDFYRNMAVKLALPLAAVVIKAAHAFGAISPTPFPPVKIPQQTKQPTAHTIYWLACG